VPAPAADESPDVRFLPPAVAIAMTDAAASSAISAAIAHIGR
jgi:hypothetical protein